VDETGEPVIGTRAQASRLDWLNGGSRWTVAGSDGTDDRGSYRIFGLQPGTYCVSAVPPQHVELPVDRQRGVDPAGVLAYAPTYHPCAIALEEATTSSRSTSRGCSLALRVSRGLGAIGRQSGSPHRAISARADDRSQR
jgi:hypothetical protein